MQHPQGADSGAERPSTIPEAAAKLVFDCWYDGTRQGDPRPEPERYSHVLALVTTMLEKLHTTRIDLTKRKISERELTMAQLAQRVAARREWVKNGKALLSDRFTTPPFNDFVKEARSDAAQLWQLPEMSGIPINDVVCEVVAQKLAGHTYMAAQAENGRQYYRDLLVQCGTIIGIEARTADDGTVHQEVLCAKIPELVEKLAHSVDTAAAEGLETEDRDHLTMTIRLDGFLRKLVVFTMAACATAITIAHILQRIRS